MIEPFIADMPIAKLVMLGALDEDGLAEIIAAGEPGALTSQAYW